MEIQWKNRHVLVTEAGGFIGSHLVEKLVNLGVQVRAFVRYNSRNNPGLLRFLPDEVIKEVDIFPGDLRDSAAVTSAALGCDTIFHLGALIAIPYSYDHPAEVVETNILDEHTSSLSNLNPRIEVS